MRLSYMVLDCVSHSGIGKVASRGAATDFTSNYSSSAGPPSSSGVEMTVVDTRNAVGLLMNLLVPQSELEASKLPKVWVGDVLPAIRWKT